MKPSNPRIWFLLAILLAVFATEAATIGRVQTVNVTPSSFTIIWFSDHPEAEPLLELYAPNDLENPLEGELAVEYNPLHTGDPSLARGYERRGNLRTLKSRARTSGHFSVRVSGGAPGSTYAYRVGIRADGETVLFPSQNDPLPMVTLMDENSFVSHASQLVLTVHAPDPIGWTVTLQKEGSPYAVASVVGDGAAPNEAVFNLNDFQSSDGAVNFDQSGSHSFSVTVYRAGLQVDAPLDFDLSLSPDFSVVDIFQRSAGGDGETVLISGRILYQKTSLPVANARVELIGSNQTLTTLTDAQGHYQFQAPANREYGIKPSRSHDLPYNQGVTTLDILLLRAHILNSLILNSPHSVLAADVQFSNSASTLDILLMRRLILGIEDYYLLNNQNNEPLPMWRFVPSDIDFADPLRPWNGLVEEKVLQASAANALDQDFVAVKLGDVNASWTPVGVQPGNRLPSQAGAVQKQGLNSYPSGLPTFAIANAVGSQGGEVRVPITLSGVTQLTSLQFTIGWDPTVMKLGGLSRFGLDHAGGENVGLEFVDQGLVSFSWDDLELIGKDFSGESTLFELVFSVLGPPGSETIVGLKDVPTPFEISQSMSTIQSIVIPGLVVVGEGDGESPDSGSSYHFKKNGSFSLKVDTQIGRTYVLEATQDLTTPVWVPVDLVVGTGSSVGLIDNQAGFSSRFYRITIRNN